MRKSILAAAGAAVCAGAAIAIRRRREQAMAGKVVVITGGSRGLGLALAREFGRRGSRIVIAARDEGELQAAMHMLMDCGQHDVLSVVCDLTQTQDAQRLIEQATLHFGHIDVLINNAAIIHIGPIEKQSVNLFRDAMESNFFGMLHATYAVLPQMLERGSGAIVNVASIGGKIPVPHLAPYTASKFAMVGFSETLNAEVRSKGIRVTTVNPGLMRTGSYPNAIVVGQHEEEYRWFSLSASLPPLAHSASYAARKIFQAVAAGRSEVEIGLDAYLAARLHGVSPDITQFLGNLAERLILPQASGTDVPIKGSKIKVPMRGIWQKWSDRLATQFNQPH